MSNFTSQSSLLNLAPKAEVKGVQTSSSKSDFYTSDESFTPSFLASLVQALDESNELLPQNLQITEKELMQEFILKQNNLFGGLSEEQKTSIFDSLSFMQVLAVLEDMQIQNTEVKLSSLSTQTQQFLQTQSNLDALKGAKNLDELLQIAKDLKLEVSNIKIDKIFELKSTFPNLNKANFFSPNIEGVFKEFLNTKIAHIIKDNENKLNTQNTKHKTQNTTNLLSKALQNLAQDDDSLLKSEVKNTVQKSFDLINDSEELSIKNQKFTSQTSKEPQKQVLLNEKASKIQPNLSQRQEVLTTQPKMSALKEKAILTQEHPKDRVFKELVQESKPNNEVAKSEFKASVAPKTFVTIEQTQAQSKVTSSATTNEILNDSVKNQVLKKELKKDEKEHKFSKEPQKELKNMLNEKIITKIDEKPVVKNEKSVDEKVLLKQNEPKTEFVFKNEPKSTPKAKETSLNTEKKSFVSQENVSKELKIQPIKENISLPNTENKASVNLEMMMNKTQSKLSDFNVNLNNTSSQNFSENKESSSSQSEMNSNFIASDDNSELNSLIKDLSQVSRSELKSELNIKETFTRFAQDFKEQMQHYKSPITRFNITLHPSNLGEVEVTLIQRGSNLHINFNSSTNAMNLFIQNQAEFKNSLVNMGFTGLEMNFSDQNKKEKQQQGKNRNGFGFKEELSANENSTLEFILARYF